MRLFLLQGNHGDLYFLKMRQYYQPVASLGALLLFVFSLTSNARADVQMRQAASDLYSSGKFEAALQTLQSKPEDSAQYYYNLGTVFFRLGKTGIAVAYLEKANRLESHDADIRFNLQAARGALGRQIGQDRLDPTSSWVEAISDRVSLDEVRATLGLLALILTLTWLRSYLKFRALRQTLLSPGALICLSAFLITSVLYGAQKLSELHPPAVAIEREVVRSGPGTQFIEMAQVEPGMKVRLLGPISASPDSPNSVKWRQVRYSKDGLGWIPESSLLLL